MKTILLSICFIFFNLSQSEAQNTDLPAPTANLQTLPAGSYVIAMDNTNQPDKNGFFNLSSYGLIVKLLNSSKKLKWVIKAGKAKDGIDFTVNATKIKPVAGTAASFNFKGGPFVIFAPDTAGVSAIVDTHNSAFTNVNDKVKIYKTNAAVSVDIRYNMTGYKPKAAILNDGANQNIHIDFMQYCSIPTSNYMVASGQSLLTDCFTFASEAHNDKSGPTIDASIAAVKAFVIYGGNFLAECRGVSTYENNPLGHFQTTTGVTDANSNAGTAITYSNPDLSFSQFEGSYDISVTGSLQNWRNNAASTNNFHKHAQATADATVIGASVSKLKTGSGGLCFYLGNHKFTPNNVSEINGIRMYMNAFLTPVSVAGSCNIGDNYMYPLALKFISFQGYVTNTTARLSWEVSENENIKNFVVERSINGTDFTASSPINSNNRTGNAAYPYTDNMIADMVYYRIKMTDKSGVVSYSKTIILKSNTEISNGLKIINNPVNDDRLSVEFTSVRSGQTNLRIIDMLGRTRFSQPVNSNEGTNVINIALPSVLEPGVYVTEIIAGTEHLKAKFIRQ